MNKIKELLINILIFIVGAMAIVLIPLTIIVIGLFSIIVLVPLSFMLDAIFGEEKR